MKIPLSVLTRVINEGFETTEQKNAFWGALKSGLIKGGHLTGNNTPEMDAFFGRLKDSGHYDPSLAGGGSEAGNKSQEAKNASIKAEKSGSKEDHKAAQEAHESAGMAHLKAGNESKAGEHFDKEKEHKGAIRDAGESGKASSKAWDKSDKANDEGTRKGHREAGAEHNNAAKIAREEGNHRDAAAHEGMAKSHYQTAKEMEGKFKKPTGNSYQSVLDFLINAERCPECGGRMEDGECEECGYEMTDNDEMAPKVLSSPEPTADPGPSDAESFVGSMDPERTASLRRRTTRNDSGPDPDSTTSVPANGGSTNPDGRVNSKLTKQPRLDPDGDGDSVRADEDDHDDEARVQQGRDTQQAPNIRNRRRSNVSRRDDCKFSQNSNPEGHNQYTTGGDPPSPKAHKILTSEGWVHQGGGSYVHGSKPGHEINVTGHEDAGGGRQRMTWEHNRPGKEPIRGAGTEALAYHTMRESTRNISSRRDDYGLSGNADMSDKGQRDQFFGAIKDKGQYDPHLGGEDHSSSAKDASQATSRAKETGSKKTHTDALEKHQSAAKEALDKSTKFAAKGDKGSAKHWREQANMHSSQAKEHKKALTGNSWRMITNAWDPDAADATMAARKATRKANAKSDDAGFSGSAHDEAEDSATSTVQSLRDNRGGKDSTAQLVQDHSDAADQHDMAAQQHDKMGQDEASEAHERAAQAHRDAADAHGDNEDTTGTQNSRGNMTTNQKINWLRGLVRNCTCLATKRQLQSILNEASGTGDGSFDAAVMTGRDDDGNPGIDDGNDDDDEYAQRSKKKVKKNTLSTNQWLQQAPPDAREMLQEDYRGHQRKKAAIVRRLTANISNPDRMEVRQRELMSNSLGELKELLELVGNREEHSLPVQEPYDPLPLYGPAGVALTSNQTSGDGEVLDIPVLNFGNQQTA